MKQPLVLLLLFYWFSTGVFASEMAALDFAHIHQLATEHDWLDLLHADHEGHSEAQGPGFFVATDGNNHPEHELDADISVFYKRPTLQCRFPARLSWLKDQLGSLVEDLPVVRCPEYEQWRRVLNVHAITLVFASDYINNPSSMFGHTFLRLDPTNPVHDPLLSYAVSYAAATRESNGLVFAVKGLTGGYPGEYSLMPYYRKVNEYSNMEQRDLWEYTLDLKPAEINRMVSHIWELQDVHFPYYFFSDNCAWELLKLLDIARPDLHASQAFRVYTIPADTVRWVFAHKLVARVQFRPSIQTDLLNDLNTMPSDVAQRIQTLLINSETSNTDHLDKFKEQMALQDTYRLLLIKKPGGTAWHQQALELLKKRALLGPESSANEPFIAPATDPAKGHGSADLVLGAGSWNGHGDLVFGLRPAYQGPDDDQHGYRPGAMIQFLSGQFALETQSYRWHIEDASLIRINSYTPWAPFLRPISWSLQAHVFDQPDNQRWASVHGGAGATWSGWNGTLLSHALVEGGFWWNVSQHKIEPGISIPLGIGAEWGQWHTDSEIRAVCATNFDCWLEEHASLNRQIHQNRAVRFSIGAMQWQKNMSWQASVMAIQYY